MSEFRRRLLAKKDDGELKKNEILAIYNVTSTSSATTLLGSIFNIAAVLDMWIDGTKITPAKTYTFATTGEHTVKLKMANVLTSLYGMFYICSNLVSADLSHLNTSKVINFNRIFYICSNLVSVNVSIDTSSAQDFTRFFYNCGKLISVDLGSFNTSKVTVMSGMFTDCQSLKTLNLSGFDVGKVTDFGSMFFQNYKLTDFDPFYNWKQADLRIQYTNFTPLAVHRLIERSASVADGAVARTLTLTATSKTNWQNSEYFYSDYLMLEEKNITISGLTITTINIPEGVTTIPDNAFSELTSLTSITIPSTVTYIGDNAFSGCINISKIIMKPTTAPTLGENVWGDNESNYVGSNVSYDKYVGIKDEYIGYDTDKWNVLFNECGFIKIESSSIEYLESQSTNGQYINTNYLVKSTDVIKIKFSFINSILNSQPIFGWRWNGHYDNNYQCYINTADNSIKITIGAGSINTLGIPVTLNSKYEIEINPNAQKIFINGIETTVNKGGIDWSAIYSNGNSVYPPYLFALNNIGTKTGANNVRIYDYIVHDINGNRVQHLIPALDDNNRPCMYDLINNTYHYNQSTGNDFTYQI